MEEREASVASSTDFYESDKKPDTPAGDTADDSLLLKRKAEDFESPQHKRPKLDSPSAPSSPEPKPCAGLPPAIWQHIFLSCPLRTLGRLLQVNRSFHSYLTDVRNVSAAKPPLGFVRLLKSESIWASARNMHPTKPPKPLPGFSELQMWQLVWSDKCQFCSRESAFTPGEKIWQKGPGAAGVRIVWPFAMRTCGTCLLERCQTVCCPSPTSEQQLICRMRISFSRQPRPCAQPYLLPSLPTTRITFPRIPSKPRPHQRVSISSSTSTSRM
jgi:hypothetical protein